MHPRVRGLAKNEVIEHRFITPRLIKASNSAGQWGTAEVVLISLYLQTGIEQ